MAAYVHDTQFFTRRSIVLMSIILLHIGIFWALATGLAQRTIAALAPPIQTEIVQEDQKKVEPPPPPPPEFQKPPVEVPPPDVTIDMPVEAAPTTAISNVTTAHVPTAPAPVVRAGPSVPIKGKFGPTDGYYPDSSRRLGEEGSTQVHVCVGANGKLTGAPTIVATSGHERLDQGAISYAKDTRYAPAQSEGKPIDSCLDFRVKFTLH